MNSPLSSAPRPRRNLPLLLGVSAALITLAALIQLAHGAYALDWAGVWRAVNAPEVWENSGFLGRLIFGDGLGDRLGLPVSAPVPTASLIIWNIRLPRILVGIMVGINLAFAGGIFQAITRNEMASPYLLGVSSGAGLVILAVLVLYPGLSAQLPLIAMVGGVGAFAIVYAIAWKNGASPVRLILAGIIVGAIAGSLQTALFFWAGDISTVQNALAWTAGSLTGTGWAQVRMLAPWTVLTTVASLAGTRYLDVLTLGDQTARSLGMRVDWARFLLAANAILAASSAVAAAGLVGFVGLIVPHIVRSLVGSSHRPLLFGCLFAGPALLVSADTAARLVLSPVQIPVGIVTGIFGGVFFLYLMRKKQEFGRL